MKLEFEEYKFGASVILIPETPAEVAKLMRFGINAKQSVPQIYLSFGGDSPILNINFDKVSPTVQVASIKPRFKP